MKTIPISRPGAGPEPTPNASVTNAQAARERAIAKLSTPPNSQPVREAPVGVNPNAISAEDLSAVTSQVSRGEDQSNTSVEPSAETLAPTRSEELPSSQMAIIARKERALRAKAQQIEQSAKAREAQLQAEYSSKLAELNAKIEEYKTGYIQKDYIKQNTLDAMEQAGVTYDDYVQQMMSVTPTDPRVAAQISRQEQKINELQAKLEAQEQKATDQQTQSYQAALRQIENDVKGLVKSDPNFEAIRFTRSEKDVVELIERTYQEEGRVMSVEEAASEVENYLVEEATKLARLEKIRQRTSAPIEGVKKPDVNASQTPGNKQPQQIKTLTNSAGTARKLSARERALLAFKGELKS